MSASLLEALEQQADALRNPLQRMEGGNCANLTSLRLSTTAAPTAAGCLPKDVALASEEVYPIFAFAEVDTYPVCEACGREHDYMILNQYGPVASIGEDG